MIPCCFHSCVPLGSQQKMRINRRGGYLQRDCFHECGQGVRNHGNPAETWGNNRAAVTTPEPKESGKEQMLEYGMIVTQRQTLGSRDPSSRGDSPGGSQGKYAQTSLSSHPTGQTQREARGGRNPIAMAHTGLAASWGQRRGEGTTSSLMTATRIILSGGCREI